MVGEKDYKPVLAKKYVVCIVVNCENGFQEDVLMQKLKFGKFYLNGKKWTLKFFLCFSVLLSLLFGILDHLNGRQVCYRNVQLTYMHCPKCHIAVQ